MSNKINWIRFLQRVSSILLILSMVLQIFIIALLGIFDENIDELELDEIHEISGFILLGLMLVHTVLYWKSLKTLLLRTK